MKLSLLTVIFTSIIAAAGCAAEAGADGDVDTTNEALGVSVPNPSGAYFASVTANGTGCMTGSWNAEISHDGKQLAIHFEGYDTSIEPGQSIAMKDCTIGIDLKSPRGLSFAVTSMDYEGHAQLDEGVKARLSFHKYYFQGNPVAGHESQADLVGPFDDSYVDHDEVAPADRVWSPCSTTRRLNAQTRVVMYNDAQRSGSGLVEVNRASTSLRFGIAWRTC